MKRKPILTMMLIGLIIIIGLTGCQQSSIEVTTTPATPPATTAPIVAAETTRSETKSPASTTSSYSSKSSSYGTTKEKVICSMCNGTGKVKYYYGESSLEAALNGKNDYEYGPCTSCNGTGYTYVNTTKSSGSSSNLKTCPSCGDKVSNLITKKDAAGVNRTWCSKCWNSYNKIMGY